MKAKIFYILASIFITFNCVMAQDQNTSIDSTKTEGTISIIEKADQTILIIAGILLLIWIAMVVIYLVWAIHRYGSNYGLSDREWKILKPEVYAKKNEQNVYKKLRQDAITREQEKINLNTPDDATPEVVTTPFEEPKVNPYIADSFGLPPNTIRGIIALTALFIFVLMEGINFFSTIPVEKDFGELILALQMVIAFYFGSRAVEVFKTKSESKEEETKEKTKPTSQPAEVVKQPETTQITKEPEVEKEPVTTEKALLPEEKSKPRIINVLENLNTVQPPAIIPGTKIQNRPLPERILSLTGSFETGEDFPKCFAGLAGNFDGQGISFGILQWNFGQGSLPPLLEKMNDNYGATCKKIFGSFYNDFERMFKMTKTEQLAWSKTIQYTQVKNSQLRWYIDPNWIEIFRNLGVTDEMILIQTEAANLIYKKAENLTDEYEVKTQRGLSLMFDILTQNGSVDRKGSGKRIKDDYLTIPSSLSDNDKQKEKMIIIANRRAEVSNPKYVEDVRSRKMTIATGEGKVHSKNYNLEKDFNITLDPF